MVPNCEGQLGSVRMYLCICPSLHICSRSVLQILCQSASDVPTDPHATKEPLRFYCKLSLWRKNISRGGDSSATMIMISLELKQVERDPVVLFQPVLNHTKKGGLQGKGAI